MKRSFAVFTAALLAAATLSLGACELTLPDAPTSDGPAPEAVTLSVYAPDGAPALALANFIEDKGAAARSADPQPTHTFTYDIHVVDANQIVSFVTGEAPKADFCILPLNAASLQLGMGEAYKMAGTVTNGNLYFITTGENPALTEENLDTLVGKKLGVVQLPNVPGLTLRATLKDHDIPFQVIESAQAQADAAKVNLVPFAPDNVTPTGGCDYYLVPEPAASAKIKGTASTAKPFKAAGDLQAIYGEGGYPQAVLVVKNSVVEQYADAVDEVGIALSRSEDYLKNAEPAKLIDLLASKRTEGLTPSFNANNLTKEVVAHCSVRYTPAKDCKAAVLAFLQKLMEVDATSAKVPADKFFL